jgi:hypothetical protein
MWPVSKPAALIQLASLTWSRPVGKWESKLNRFEATVHHLLLVAVQILDLNAWQHHRPVEKRSLHQQAKYVKKENGPSCISDVPRSG